MAAASAQQAREVAMNGPVLDCCWKDVRVVLCDDQIGPVPFLEGCLNILRVSLLHRMAMFLLLAVTRRPLFGTSRRAPSKSLRRLVNAVWVWRWRVTLTSVSASWLADCVVVVYVLVYFQHAEPIKSINWVTVGGKGVLATGSWDRTIKYWDLRQPPAPVVRRHSSPGDARVSTRLSLCFLSLFGLLQLSITLPERLYTMDAAGPLLVAGTADRQLLIFDINKPQAPMRVCAHLAL